MAENLAAPSTGPVGSVERLVGTWRQNATDCLAQTPGGMTPGYGSHRAAATYRECADELALALATRPIPLPQVYAYNPADLSEGWIISHHWSDGSLNPSEAEQRGTAAEAWAYAREWARTPEVHG